MTIEIWVEIALYYLYFFIGLSGIKPIQTQGT